VHGTPERIGRVEVADDLDRPLLTNPEQPGIVTLSHGSRAASGQRSHDPGGIGGRKADVVERLRFEHGFEIRPRGAAIRIDLDAVGAEPFRAAA
jgi:hypothetical protein